MSTEKQKEAARRNIEKAREVQSERAHGEDIPRSTEGISTAEKDRLADAEFAFPQERKEPLTDAAHVRNAIARFDQVEGVTDEERDRAWKRIRAAGGKRSGSLDRLEGRLRALPRPVIGRIAEKTLWLDLRCLEPADEAGFTAQWSAFER